MAELGKNNTLKVVELVDFGVYLDGGETGKILMPKRYVPEGCNIDDEVDVFVYLDSEDRPVATTEKPLATVGEFEFLKVVSVTQVGAFLDWGLAKDLLVPFREQKMRMETDRWYVVHIYIDVETNRIVGSAKIDKFLDNVPPEYNVGDEVDILVSSKSDLGYNAIINNLHTGVLYQNETFKPLRVGHKLKAYIKKVREDDKIDLLLEKPGHKKLDDIAQAVYDALIKANGFLPLGDKSAPETIYHILGMSKKNFKKAIGTLYRLKKIVIEDEGVRLV